MIQDLHERFLDRSAPYWRENKDMTAIFWGQAGELVRTDGLITTYLVNELFLDSATAWGLSLMEHRFGLVDNVQRTLTERRGRIRAAKRGGRNANIPDLEIIAAGFIGGMVDINIDYDAFEVTIEFVDQLGIPTRIADVQAAMDRALPAYYTIIYKYRYNTYNDVKTAYATYDELKASGLTYSQVLTTEGD